MQVHKSPAKLVRSSSVVSNTPRARRPSRAGLLCTCIAVDAYFIGCEILTTAYNGTEDVYKRQAPSVREAGGRALRRA